MYILQKSVKKIAYTSNRVQNELQNKKKFTSWVPKNNYDYNDCIPIRNMTVTIEYEWIVKITNEFSLNSKNNIFLLVNVC